MTHVWGHVKAHSLTLELWFDLLPNVLRQEHYRALENKYGRGSYLC